MQCILVWYFSNIAKNIEVDGFVKNIASLRKMNIPQSTPGSNAKILQILGSELMQQSMPPQKRSNSKHSIMFLSLRFTETFDIIIKPDFVF